MALDENRVQQYLDQLRDLLPPGKLFSAPDGSNLANLLLGLGENGCRVEDRVADLALERDPATTTEKVGDWERALGLPGDCGETPANLALRRLEIVAKFTATGGSNKTYFVDLAARLGFTITIEEHRAFKVGSTLIAGSTSGDALTNEPDWPYTWTVHAPPVTPEFFRAGEAVAGDALAEADNGRLECTFELLKPAHTIVRFLYDGADGPYLPWDQFVPPPTVIALGVSRTAVQIG